MDRRDVRRLISFFKWRCWRFSDDLHAHVVAEYLEDLVRSQRELGDKTTAQVARFITAQAEDGSVPFDTDVVAAEHGIDIREALDERCEFSRLRNAAPPTRPRLIVSIVGAPRSGTTTLFDRLAYRTSWAVLTDHSHHLWAPWSLARARPYFLRLQPSDVLERDTREVRLDPSISWPNEAENVFHRAMPAYRHTGGHRYELSDRATVRDAALLQTGISAHLTAFGTDTLLMKSPFNVSRTQALCAVVGGQWLTIHMMREPTAAARSIERTGFQYSVDGRQLSSSDAVDWFRQRAAGHADISVDYRNLMADTARTLDELLYLAKG